MPLIFFLAILLSPVGLALVVAYLGAPSATAPIILLASGTFWIYSALRVGWGLATEIGDEKELPYTDALHSIDGAEMLARRPQTILVPFLFTAGWMLIVAGAVWLGFVNVIAAALVSIALVSIYKLWPSVRRKQPRT